MTKTLKTLIKLHKNKLDKILKDIEFKESEKLRLEEKKILIEEELNQEIEKYSTTEFSFILEKYVETSRKLIKRIEAQINQLETIIIKLRIDLRDQYSELKKYEIAFGNKQALELEAIKKYEAKQLDEFSINKFVAHSKTIAAKTSKN